MFKNLFTPSGRVSRRYFWLVGTISLVGAFASIGLAQTASATHLSIAILGLMLFVLFLWVNLATQIKRWHDINRSGWAILWNIFPGGTIVIVCVCGFYEGTRGPNRFGDRQIVMPPPLPPMFEDRQAQPTAVPQATNSALRNAVLAFIVLLGALLCVFAFSLLRETSLADQSTRNAPKSVFNKVNTKNVMITSFDAFDHEIMQGSGVILGQSPSNDREGPFRLVRGTDVVTNYHIIRNANYVVVSTKNGTSHLGAVIYFSQALDLALLRIPLENVSDNTTISFSASVGDPVYTVSNPQGLGWTLSEGIISRSSSALGEPLQFTAPVSSGSSGGGLFDGKGNLIGIITSTLNESQNLNFAINFRDFSGYINDIRLRRAVPFSSVDSNDWRTGAFKADNEDRNIRRSNYENAYISKRQLMIDQAIQEFHSLTFTERTEDKARAAFSEPTTAFFRDAQELISSWREEYPNDPNAILANIKMLYSTGRENDANGELAKALDQFPLNIDIIRESASVLSDNKRNNSLAALLTAISKRVESKSKNAQRFSDDWSNQHYDASRIERDLTQKQFIDEFNQLVEVYSRAGIVSAEAKIK